MAERKTCTVDHPMPFGDKGFWQHPEAIHKYDGGDYDSYECPICGLYFSVEVAQ